MSASRKPDSTIKSSLSASSIINASQDNSLVDAQCRSCVNLLKQVLQSADSKPSQLLASLFNDESRLVWRAAPNGIEVQIPVEQQQQQSTVPRRLSRLHPPEVNDDIPVRPKAANTGITRPSMLSNIFASEQQLATSAVSDNATPTNNEQQPTEWMSVRCQPCKLTGPEGGARAFVMGPTPLSVVVCTNRLRSNVTSNSWSNNGDETTTAAAAAARQEMEEILTHELVHVHDVRMLQLDLRDCESLAYSEVRAAREAECFSHSDSYATLQPPATPAWYTLGMRSNKNTKQSCASRTAETATSNLFPQRNMAKDCVNKVFDQAYGDARPFAKTTTASAKQQERK
ncbi:hypothetical protein MPSEU_000056500 [Mayamaea pseudoterrestris]|nr:hypothetical protein MPSEU_000056500 [Mayamaea pseudoterrestris]